MQPTVNHTIESKHRFRVASCSRRTPPTRQARSPLTPEVGALAGLSLLAAALSASSTGVVQVVTAVAALATSGLGRAVIAQPIRVRSPRRS